MLLYNSFDHIKKSNKKNLNLSIFNIKNKCLLFSKDIYFSSLSVLFPKKLLGYIVILGFINIFIIEDPYKLFPFSFSLLFSFSLFSFMFFFIIII
jgi:hypothetical protein